MKKILGILVIICGLGIGFFGLPAVIGNTIDDFTSKIQNGDENAVTEKLSYIAELSVIDYKYSNAVAYKDSLSIEKFEKEFNIPLTKKEIVMTYDGDIKIGVDVSKITVSVGKGGGKNVTSVTVGLPEPMITSHTINRDSIAFPIEKNNIFNQLITENYDKLEVEAKAKMEEAVQKNGTMDRAKEELRINMTSYLKVLYGDDVEVTFEDLEE